MILYIVIVMSICDSRVTRSALSDLSYGLNKYITEDIVVIVTAVLLGPRSHNDQIISILMNKVENELS